MILSLLISDERDSPKVNKYCPKLVELLWKAVNGGALLEEVSWWGGLRSYSTAPFLSSLLAALTDMLS